MAPEVQESVTRLLYPLSAFKTPSKVATLLTAAVCDFELMIDKA